MKFITILYIPHFETQSMKSKHLLSIVFSLIMFTGVTAGNSAFAQSDEVGISDSEEIEITVDDVTQDEHDNEKEDDYDEKHDDEKHDDEKHDDEKHDDEKHDDKEEKAKHDNLDNFEIDDLLKRFCDATDDDRLKLFADYPRLEQFKDRLTNYCEMSETEQDAVEDFLENYKDEINANIQEHIAELKMNSDKDMREQLEKYCQMSDEDKNTFLTEHDKAEDHSEKMNQYCVSDEDERIAFIESNREEHKEHMKKMMEDKHHSLDYEKLCSLSESERASEITDLEKLDKINSWCVMTPEEQEDYKMKHHDDMADKMHDKMSCECHKGEDGNMSCPMMDGESDMQCSMMDKKHEKIKFSDKSERLKTMIMSKHDISDERHDEIKMKFKEKHGDFTNEEKSELKMKFKKHMKSMKSEMTDERKISIHDRLAEMKAFKAELREKSSEMTDEEKQQLREEFIEKAKDMQLAWISPRTQITAGIDATEVECREGFSLVLKESNGVPMCLKADTALVMIERGIAVPA